MIMRMTFNVVDIGKHTHNVNMITLCAITFLPIHPHRWGVARTLDNIGYQGKAL
jgi:hypothetical protein